MIEVMNESAGNMLAVKATDTLTNSDYTNVWIPALQKLIDEYEKINCLLYLDENFKGWSAKAMWDDAHFGLKHRSDFNKIAVVGGPAWLKWGVKVGELMLDGEAKTFQLNQLTEALDWVK